MLLGLASLAVVALALFGWDQFGFATRAQFLRPVVVAGVAGALLFLGGPVLLVRKGRPLGDRGREDDG